MTRRRLLAACILLTSAIVFTPRAATVIAAQWPSAATALAPEYGPANGALVIVGGGSTAGTTIINKFIELGGGVDGRFVIVPTANGNYDGPYQNNKPHVYVESQVIAPWLNRGLKHVRMLHTHDPAIANTPEFAGILSDATAVWFDGGRHWRIVDSYAGTLTYHEFHRVLERGGVIGGSSAGATIQGEYLVRGDSTTNTIVMTDEPNHQLGFEFLRKSAIDQHIDARNRWDDLIPVIQRFPHLLGIGISEGTAIIVKGDEFEVMGKSKVAIHDNQRKYPEGEKQYYLLSAGDKYNMRTRKIVTAAETPHRTSTTEPAQTPHSPAASPTGGLKAAGYGGSSRPAVPAPMSISLPQLLDRLLAIAGDDEHWQIEAIDVDGDGETDLLRIRLINPINGETTIWEIRR